MRSAKIAEYVIVDSTRQYAIRYSWSAQRHFVVNEYYRGPIMLASLDVRLAFADIYAQTNVPFVVHPVHADDDPVLP